MRAEAAITNLEAERCPTIRLVVRDINASSVWRDRVRVENANAHLVAPIDPDAFAIAIRNLVENGLKHGAPDRPVQVVLGEPATVRVPQ